MSNEISWDSETGETWDAYRFKKNGNVLLSNGASDEEWGTGGRDADYYDIPVPEVGVGGHYVGDFDPDDSVATNRYMVKVCKRKGVNPANSDLPARARGPINWDGVNHIEIFDAEQPDIVSIQVDVAGLNGDAMVGTNNAALAASLVTHHTTLTNHAGVLDAHNTGLNQLTDLVDTQLDVVLSTRMTPSDLSAAMKAIIGITVGGAWTWEKIMKITTAWIAGNWRRKSSNLDVQELLDAEDGATVILEQQLTHAPGGGSDYRSITVKI